MIEKKSDTEIELNEIKERYSRRKILSEDLYNPLMPYVYMIQQEKERVFIKWIKNQLKISVNNLKLLEIGCGSGGNLLEFIRLGFNPANLTGNELLIERVIDARSRLNPNLKIIEGNALDLDLSQNYFDIVFQSMVFSSILNDDFKIELAAKMWQLTKPGGGVLWYDFTFNNPKNKDVKGIKFQEVKLLFPNGTIKKWKLTLAPPLSRIVTKIHPSLYSVFNIFPFFRTHILCWIKKTK